jgi:hypothetical protein
MFCDSFIFFKACSSLVILKLDFKTSISFTFSGLTLDLFSQIIFPTSEKRHSDAAEEAGIQITFK